MSLIIIRAVAALTVILSLGLMAVSAYAAKTAPPVVEEAEPDLQQSEVEAGSRIIARVAAQEAAATATHVPMPPPPTPTLGTLHAAPEAGASRIGVGGGRGDLSPGLRTWDVLSVPPGFVDPTSLMRDGVDIPSDQLSVMLRVGHETGIPWQIFGALAKIESDLGRNMSTSSAGAIGYGQFLPWVWGVYGEGGDPYDFRDVIPAMGRYLLDSGAPDDIPAALYAYNHSWAYVAQVLSFAATLGYEGPDGTPPTPREGLLWPLTGPISSYYGPDHPLGIDIDQTMAPGTPVLAAHSGVVLFAGGDACCSYGYYVVLASQSGLQTLYAHLDIIAVDIGDSVHRGQPLGIVGNTGYSTGTHLHFEVIDGGYRQDPLLYLP